MQGLLRHYRWFAIFTLLVCAFAWYLDLAGHIYACPYCQTQRTMIGVLGVLMLLPRFAYLTMWLVTSFAFLSASTSSAQILLTIKNHDYFNMNFNLAFCSLFFVVLQITVMYLLGKQK